MQPNTENAKQALARIHNAHVRAQLTCGVLHASDVARDYRQASDATKVDLLTCVALRATTEMAIAQALGDAVAGRVDLLVLRQVHDLFGADMALAVAERIAELDGTWPRTVTPWPAPLAKRAARHPWWMRAFAWAFGGRS